MISVSMGVGAMKRSEDKCKRGLREKVISVSEGVGARVRKEVGISAIEE